MSKILITGATGQQGGATINALLKAGPRVPSQILALTRSTSSPAATALAAKSSSIQLVQGSFSSPSLVTALSQVDSVFFMSSPMGKGGVEDEIQQGEQIVSALAKVRASGGKVPRVVYTSVDGAERNSGVPHFDSKYRIETLLRAEVGEQNLTVLRPVAFMDNFSKKSGIATFLFFGIFRAALLGKKVQYTSVKDIGVIGAEALLDPSEYAGKAIGIAGDELSINEVQDTYARVHGSRPWKLWLPGFVINLLPLDMKAMFLWFRNTAAYQVNIPALRAQYPQLQTFEDWLKDE
ncbi:NmrA family protein [Pseudohyphozyma bogoriensis]|nr:NmrA family protein [Pseudohyphozyma bogoriensis]